MVANPAFDQGRGKTIAQATTTQSIASSIRSDSQQRSGELADLQFDPLPGTAREGQAIAAITGARLLEQQQATANAINEQASPRLLHLATHAYYLPDQPAEQLSDLGIQLNGASSIRTRSGRAENPLLRSGIALAGANHPESNPADDGHLTALEVAQLDWDGTELVVISACESGLGDIKSGEGVYGLKRAIAVAGARSSLLSLWKVDDDATAAFMKSFYNYLKDGKGRADALATTQKDFRLGKVSNSDPLNDWTRPYFWAAFQLSGDWKPIQGI